MAKTIEELNFKLKIDRKDFDREIAEANKQAAKLNMELSRLLEIKKAQGNLTNKEYLTLKRLDNLESNRRINAEKEMVAHERRLAVEDKIAAAKEKQNTHQSTQNRLLSEAKNIALSYLSIWGAKKLLGELVSVTGEFEMQRTTLRAMLQDAQGADAIYEQIKQLAVVSPFGFKELVTYTKQLAAYSIPIGELYDTTKMLADVSAGLGVGMDRLVLAYGQVRSAAFLRGQEVRQFTEAGIPILQMLADQFSQLEHRVVSTGEVFDKISRRMVPFEMVAKAFRDMTSEGGKFFNMQEIQAETLQGKISNLKDAYEIMLSEIGEKLEPVLKGLVDAIRDLMANYERVGKSIVELVAIYGTYRTALVLTKVASKDLSVTLRLLEINFKKVGAAISGTVLKNPYTAIAAAATAAAFAIYKLIDAKTGESRLMENYNRNTEKMESGIVREVAALDALYAKFEVAKAGTEDYESAKTAIYSKYSEYIAAIKDEGAAIDDLAALYGKLKEKVQEATREKFLRTALSDADEDFDAEVDRIYKKFTKRFKDSWIGKRPNGFEGATARQKEAMWQYITGGLSPIELKKYVPKGWSDFIEWMRDDFKTASEEYQKIVAEIGEVKPAFNDNIVEPTTPKQETPENTDAVKALQDRIALLEKMKDVYDSFRPYFTDDRIREFFSSNFAFVDKTMWENFDFGEQMDTLVAQLDTMGEKGKEAADNIREKLATSLARDMVDGAKKSAKEMEDFNERIAKFSEEAKTAEQKIEDLKRQMDEDLSMATDNEQKSAIIAHYTTEIDKLNESLADLASIQLTEFWQSLTGNKEGTYAYLTRLQGMAEQLRETLANISPNTNRNGKITGYTLTRSGNEDLFESLGIDSESVQLTVSQVESLNKAIDSLIRKRAEKSGIATFFDSIKKDGFWDSVKEGGPEAVAVIDKAVGEFTKLAGSISAVGDAVGSGFLTAMGNIVGTTGEIITSITSKDYIGLASTLIEKFASVAGTIIETRRRISELKTEIRGMTLESDLSFGIESVFGSNTYRSIKNAYDVIAKVEGSMSGLEDTLSSITVGLYDDWWKFVPVLNTIAAFLSNGDTTLLDALEKAGASLYDATGRVNVEALEKLRESYKGISADENDALDKAIADARAYNDALDQLDATMSELVGNVAGDFAGAIIEQWKAAGNAAADYSEIISGIAEQYARMIIQDTLLAQVFDDNFKAEITQLTKDKNATEVLSLFDEKVRELEDFYPYFEEVLSGLDQYFTHTDDSGSGELSAGIKGITEETASLLASYVNAIRADVSYSRTQRDAVLSELRNIASYVAGPSLVDYMNKIQANTFDTAQSSRRILDHIESVLTNEGGLTALRVYQ